MRTGRLFQEAEEEEDRLTMYCSVNSLLLYPKKEGI